MTDAFFNIRWTIIVELIHLSFFSSIAGIQMTVTNIDKALTMEFDEKEVRIINHMLAFNPIHLSWIVIISHFLPSLYHSLGTTRER